MSAYCGDCGERTIRDRVGTLVIRHLADCPNGTRRPPDRTHGGGHPLASVPGCGKRQASNEGRDGATP